MAQYIDKSALVAEIEKRKGMCDNHYGDYWNGCYNTFTDILSFINTLEVKEFWKLANGDDLPDIDKEVIVLTQPYPLESTEYAISFAHRPNPDGWNGKSISTGKIEHYQPKTYDKGGWNIPNVKWWIDLDLPIIEEE